MPDDIIGSVTGTATFEVVKIRPSVDDDDRIEVAGRYLDSHTTYSAPDDEVFLGGLQLTELAGKLCVEHPDDDGWVWVEATETELRITKENPDQ